MPDSKAAKPRKASPKTLGKPSSSNAAEKASSSDPDRAPSASSNTAPGLNEMNSPHPKPQTHGQRVRGTHNLTTYPNHTTETMHCTMYVLWTL